jgi:hypothetical protein
MKTKILLRLFRNIILSLFSTFWFCFLMWALGFIIDFLKVIECELAQKEPYVSAPFFPYLDIASTFLTLSAIWGTVVLFFWSLYLICKAFPIKPVTTVAQYKN